MIIQHCDREIRVKGRLLKIAQLEGDGFEFLSDPNSLICSLRRSAERIDLFTFMQRLPETSPKYNYPMEWDNFAALPITSFEHWWTEQIGFKARNKAKQAAKKGVEVYEVPFDEKLVRGITQIYNETPIRQGRRFPHYGKDVSTIYMEEATFLERSIFIGAFYEEELIGFIKLVFDETGTQAGTMNILSLIAKRDKAPTNALLAAAVRSCAERGIKFLVYSQFAYGSKSRSSITDFKERNGFRRIEVPRYFVPLTPVGWFAWRFGLHRSFSELLPEWMLVKLRQIRSAWYTRKYCAPLDND